MGRACLGHWQRLPDQRHFLGITWYKVFLAGDNRRLLEVQDNRCGCVDEPPTGKVVIHVKATKTSASDASQALVTVQVVGRYQVVHASYLNSLTIMTGLGYNISDDLCSLSR